MLSSDFFKSLKDGQEYLNCFMVKDTYALIPEGLRPLIFVNKVRQKNEAFKNDPTHKELLKQKLKADTALSDYEFKINHK